MHQIATELILQDPSLKDKEVFSHDKIIAASTAAKAKGCWGCSGLNCLIKQNLSKENKIKKQYLASCKGKSATFGDLSNYGIGKTPMAEGCTTNIKPSAAINYGSDTEFMNGSMAIFSWRCKNPNLRNLDFPKIWLKCL